MPFKTKLTPNYQMNWGHNFPKAKYPQREKIPVKTFDIKAFVNKKREEKINSMLKDGNQGMPSSPFGGSSFNPFSGINSGFDRPDIGSSSPFQGGYNIDDMVKRIDAKIAELEAEEKEEELKKKEEKETVISPTETKEEVNNIITDDKLNNSSDNNLSIKDNDTKDITDDQFFDDFFSDE